MAHLTIKLTQLKRQIHSERVVSVGEKLEKNSKRVQAYVSDLEALAASRTDYTVSRSNDSGNFLSLRMNYPLCKVSGLAQGSADRDDVNSEEVVFSTTAKLPLIERIPPYTTWIFLDRNQRMADDQSVVGRRRIYYDQNGSEALICSDSEEELGQVEGEKHEFSEGEDRVMRVAFQECGVGNEVFNMLTQFVGGTSLEIQERCNMLMEKDQPIEKQNLKSSTEEGSEDNIFLDKSLSAALDSFDNLFCRRCLVFDCRLHGCSQNLIYPNEKQPYPFDLEEDRKPCGDQCYLLLNGLKDLPKSSAVDPLDGRKASDEEGSLLSPYATEQAHHLECKGRRIILEPTNSLAKASKLVSDDLLSSSSKKLKLANPNTLDHSTTLVGQVPELGGSHEYELEKSASGSVHVFQKHNLDASDCPHGVTGSKVRDAAQDKGKNITELPLKQACNFIGKSVKASCGWSDWKPFEKDLYLKGLEIFGRNSCFIARNLLPGLKTCKEVSSYMYGDGAVMSRGSSAMLSSFSEDVGKADMDHMEPDMPVKSRMCRKRGRVRKVKSSWKSAGHPSLWRRIADGKDQPCKQYAPCGCQPLCGKQCPCLQNGTCCEKYCGCSKSCKNRFRGCHCAKSQCKSRQCPCFAAGRECDPDVCRNCWVSCGDGSLGEPPRRGDSQCGNMKLLLRQQQRILLAKSDVAGWGAFLKNSVNKNDYLGEYTGELISHQEADKRGKIYDRANSSFLFDLNDKYVLDAYRKGDKLKFANHSSTPNCYAKVMLVAGDHRVGIYANEHIEAGEELFYDYRYGPDQAPAWARKPEASKRDDLPVPQGRAKKHQSG
ncbi:hypothetical protein Pfo_006057 [Paulownia fortunei]|nr:hypothetical protein Pfo_006057 [Paulownia fortunei]